MDGISYTSFGQNGSSTLRSKATPAKATTLYTICMIFFSLKDVLLWRLVISASRGCFQLPGLSRTGGGVCLTGVMIDLACPKGAKDEDDMVAGGGSSVLYRSEIEVFWLGMANGSQLA